MKKYLFLFFIIFVLVGGCAGWKKTSQEPTHAETGAGITVWKIPVLGIGLWGLSDMSGYGTSSIIVHQYNYQTKPQALAPGTPPSPPSMPMPVDYPTVYQSAFDDPTLVIFKNDSFRKVKIEIDGNAPISLDPYGATTDLHLNFGPHRAKITTIKNTYFGEKEMVVYRNFRVDLYGRSQIFTLTSY